MDTYPLTAVGLFEEKVTLCASFCAGRFKCRCSLFDDARRDHA